MSNLIENEVNNAGTLNSVVNITIFESNNRFSLAGNGQYGNVTRTGWKATRLGNVKKQAILKALSNSNVQEVYRKGNKIFALQMSGLEYELN